MNQYLRQACEGSRYRQMAVVSDALAPVQGSLVYGGHRVGEVVPRLRANRAT